MDFSHILSLLGGVAFFLYGMSAMGSGLKRVAGNKLEAYLYKLSSTPIKGFLLGTLVSAVIQSSSATSVMVVSFVNADMMKLAQAISIVLGANLGTTMTGWLLTLGSGSGIVSQLLSTSVLVSVIALTGTLMEMISKKSTVKTIGQILLGLATLLLSMSLISEAVDPLKGNEAFANILILFSNPALGTLAGIFVAMVVQSCSAAVGILQALCVTGAIPYSVCVPLILGMNIGAAAPVLFSMIGVSKSAKRASLTYLYVNICSLFLIYIVYLPMYFSGSVALLSETSTKLGIALLNTGMRVFTSIVMLPMHGLLEKLIYLTIPETASEKEDEDEIDRLTETLLNYPPAALEQAQKAVNKMSDITGKNFDRALGLLDKFDRAEFAVAQDKERLVDKYEDKLGNFVVKLGKNELTVAQQATVSELLAAIGDFERIADHASNLSETAEEIFEKKIVFSQEAQKEIRLLIDASRQIMDISKEAFLKHDSALAMQVEPLDEIVEEMTKLLRARHIERLQKNNCTILMGFVFNDLLTNFERISDHCANIAFSVLHSYDINAEGHHYSEIAADSAEYKEAFEIYRKRYLAPISNG
ncbi:MAG: Na/Pi cotransporter family protein [Clostridia bacterium]|nr:Na/Pi cotransporter family protein [Clostridia bacterium]